MTERYIVTVRYLNRINFISIDFEEDFYCTEDRLLQTLYSIRNLRQHEGRNYSPHSHNVNIIIRKQESSQDLLPA